MAQRKTFTRWIPPLCWMALIFCGSTDLLSGEHTSRFVLPILRWFLPHATMQTLDFLHLLVRKCGHVTEYAVLCVLLWRAVPERTKQSPAADWLRAGLAFIVATCYAATDEYHQSFIPSRTASAHDVLIDACGAIAGLALLWVAHAWGGRGRQGVAVVGD